MTSRDRTVQVAGWAGAASLAAVGLVTAQGAVVALGLVGAIVGGVCALMVEQSARDGGRPPRSMTDVTVAAALLGLTTVLAIAGLVVLTGPAALFIVLVVLSGVAWLRYRKSLTGTAQPTAPAVAADALPDAELALAWRNTHAELARTGDPLALARVTALRRGLLDEMERRDPAGFRQWMGGEAWVTGDEIRFLGG